MVPNVLSIAGSDPSGGAGIQADLKTFAALGCYGMAAITALTAQNTTGVSAIHVPPPDFIAEQIRMVFADVEVAAVKVGMLGSAAGVEAVADALRPHAARSRAALPIVVDPVLVATSGATLGDDAVVAALKRELFPIATIVTPNLAEAARLAGTALPDSRDAVERLGEALRAVTPTAWLVKGGHAATADADDLLHDGDAHWISSPRVATPNTHGTGCTLSSAIAASLARGRSLREAVIEAKAYLGAALRGGLDIAVGRGAGPLDHLAGRR